VRNAIATKSPAWRRVKSSKLPIEGGSLKRPPRGYAGDHPFIEDLKRTDFVTSIALKDADLSSPTFVSEFGRACRKMTPLVKFCADALRLPW
jgi:uncharacterized protein (DUF2461 family)